MLYAKIINYSSSNIVTIEASKALSLDFSFNGNSEVRAVLVDAESQEQIDTVTIKKSNARDLGGL